MKPAIEIEYCPGCRWLLRAAWTAQELLTTFESELGAVTLRPSDVSGTFHVSVEGQALWDRKAEGRFPEMKELKQRVRDHIAPQRHLGHSERVERQEDVR
ncbi:MAG: SelT/selW/selH selenoprotein [Puniceicoccaceae bacterium]|nr:SelT/selW/selH selenoprotein [Puniceicoccaceae bacterium]|tara:strand:+ start:4173 stop:4472 length:300 start_codon:yes stop_codon:yes gene_type:complete